MSKFKCIFCGWECTETKKVHEAICDHLMECHEIEYNSYYELIKQRKEDPLICWKCGNERQLYSWNCRFCH